MERKIDGDDHLSGMDKKLWQITYYCLLKFQCPVLFKYHRGYPDRKIDGCLEFFVPVQHPRSHEVVEFLEYELENENIPGTISNVCGHEHYSPGKTVIVRQFTELGIYCERDAWEKLSKQYIEDFLRMIESKEKEVQ